MNQEADILGPFIGKKVHNPSSSVIGTTVELSIWKGVTVQTGEVV